MKIESNNSPNYVEFLNPYEIPGYHFGINHEGIKESDIKTKIPPWEQRMMAQQSFNGGYFGNYYPPENINLSNPFARDYPEQGEWMRRCLSMPAYEGPGVNEYFNQYPFLRNPFSSEVKE